MTNINSDEIARGESIDLASEYGSVGEVEGEAELLENKFMAERNFRMAPDDNPTEDEANSWDPGKEG